MDSHEANYREGRIEARKVMHRRRRLQFTSLAEVLIEGTRLTELVEGANSQREDLADPDARVVHLANMPLGQALGHLGRTLNLSSDGLAYRFPLPMRLMSRLFKRQILSGALVAPFEQPAELNRVVTPGFELIAAEGLAELQAAVRRFEEARQFQPNALLGPLSREEWVSLSCRHAEWHLGFMLER